MYIKLIIKYKNDREETFEGLFDIMASDDDLVLYNVQSPEIAMWARTNIKGNQPIDYIQVVSENLSSKIFNKYTYISEFKGNLNDTIIKIT